MKAHPRMLRPLGGPLALVGAGLALAVLGLAWDFYEHEIAAVPVELESFFAPVHVMIFAGVVLAVLAYLWSLGRMFRPLALGPAEA